jgi:hypothetical protein
MLLQPFLQPIYHLGSNAFVELPESGVDPKLDSCAISMPMLEISQIVNCLHECLGPRDGTYELLRSWSVGDETFDFGHLSFYRGH